MFFVGCMAAARRMRTAAHPSPPDVPRPPLPPVGTPPPGTGPSSPSAVANDDLDDAGWVRSGWRRRLRRRGCRGGRKVKTFRGTQETAYYQQGALSTGAQLRRVGCYKLTDGTGQPVHAVQPAQDSNRRQSNVTPPAAASAAAAAAPAAAAPAAAVPAIGITVGHINVRSLMPSLGEVNGLLNTNNIDVLCISETWLSADVDDRYLVFPGYCVIRRDRKTRGGGVCVIYRASLDPVVLDVPTTGSSLETLWLHFARRRPVTICVAYRPPSGPVTPAIDDFRDQLTHVLSRGHPVHVLRDLNWDVLQPSKLGVRQYLDLLQDLSLSQLVTTPTRSAPNSPPSLLDHLITITIRSTKRLDKDHLCLDLLTAYWSSVYEAMTPSDKYDAWLTVWDGLINRHMPLIKIKVRNKPCPWVSEDEDLRRLMRERDIARAEKNHDPTPATWQAYCGLRNAVKCRLVAAKTSHFRQTFKTSKSVHWKDIRKYIISEKKPESQPSSAGSADPVWADRLNRYFASVGPDTAAALNAAAGDGETVPPRPPRVCAGSFSVRPATLPELSAALGQLGASKASGEDGVTVNVIRLTFPVIAPHLLHIVNSSLVTGVVPAAWKTAIVTPLFKSGDRCEPSNFRPISILSIVGKLCERVVGNQLVSYLTEHLLSSGLVIVYWWDWRS